MNVNDYQDKASRTAMYPDHAKILYPVLGLCGELGELVAKLFDGLWPYSTPIPDGQEPYHEALLAVIGVGRKCETLKKLIRGGAGFTEQQKVQLKDDIRYLTFDSEWVDGLVNESGDVAWYFSALITDLNTTLEETLTQNLNKLNKRKSLGNIHNHVTDSREDKQLNPSANTDAGEVVEAEVKRDGGLGSTGK